jgi:hypothetical protein
MPISKKMSIKTHFSCLQRMDRYDGVVLARFVRRNLLQQNRLTAKNETCAAIFPGFSGAKVGKKHRFAQFLAQTG